MAYSITVLGNHVDMTLFGTIDLAVTSSLKNEFESLMSSDVEVVFVNAESLDYIDSSGVASLLFIRKLCSRFGSKLVIKSISAPAVRVIQLANLDTVLGLPKAVPFSMADKHASQASMPAFSDEDALNIFKNDHT